MQPRASQPFFGVKVSKPGVPVQQATNKQLVYSNNYSTTTWYDADNPRIVEGLLPDGSYGMKASLPGYDVTTAADDQLAFSTEFTFLRVAAVINDTETVPPGSGGNNYTYAHNLNTIPALFGTAIGIGGSFPLYEYFDLAASSGSVNATIIDLNTIQVDIAQSSIAITWTLAMNFMVLTA